MWAIAPVASSSAQAGERGRHRHGAGEVGAGEIDALGGVLQRLAADAGGERVAVGERLGIAGEVGADAEALAGAAEVEAEAGAHVVEDHDDAGGVAQRPHARQEALDRQLLVVEGIVAERARR